METVFVVPAESGWAVRSQAIENEMLFRSGARAERAARRLAHALAARGEYVELSIHLKTGELAGRFVCPPPGPHPASYAKHDDSGQSSAGA